MDEFRKQRIIQGLKEINGTQNHVNTGLTTAVNTAKTMVAVAKLGNAITTAMLDPLDNMRQVFYVNGSMFGGLTEHIANFGKVTIGMNREQRIELASQLGVIYHHMSNAEGMRLSSGDLRSSGTWLSEKVDKYGAKAMNIATLLPTQTGLSRIASGLTGATAFSKIIGNIKKGVELNKFELDTLKEYGISDVEAKALANHVDTLKTWSRDIYTGKNIRDSLFKMGPEKVSKILNVSEKDAGAAINELASKYENFLNDYVTRGTPAPELATKTLLMKNTDNEVLRAGITLMTQFMDTPIAQTQNMFELTEKLARINDGSFMGAAKAMAPQLAIYMTSGVGLYLAYDGILSAAVNRESKIQQLMNGNAEERAKLMTNIIGRTSAIPFVTEMIEDQFMGRYNETALDTFFKSGPVLSTVNDILKIDSAEKAGKFLRGNLGGNSLAGQFVGNWLDAAGLNPFEQKNKKFWE